MLSPQEFEEQQESEEHYPRTLNDILQTISYLPPLPTELLKLILYHADYDCLHFTATSSDPKTVISRSAEMQLAHPYIETAPLEHLGTACNTGRGIVLPEGRIRSLRLKFTGRDQGWTSDPETSSWSWFEIGKRRSSSQQVQRGPVLAHNAVAGRDWEDHEVEYHMDREEVCGEELRTWIEGLREGERVSIVPRARYAGWQCRVLKASVDVEVEVWY